jgi:hypothetical protein
VKESRVVRWSQMGSVFQMIRQLTGDANAWNVVYVNEVTCFQRMHTHCEGLRELLFDIGLGVLQTSPSLFILLLSVVSLTRCVAGLLHDPLFFADGS